MSERSYFTQQRDLLLREIDISFGHVLANINKLNRGLEGVIDVGNEFSSVEALWSQFENVMAKDPEVSTEASAAAAAAATTAQEGQEDKTVHEGDSRNETQMDDEKRKR